MLDHRKDLLYQLLLSWAVSEAFILLFFYYFQWKRQGGQYLQEVQTGICRPSNNNQSFLAVYGRNNTQMVIGFNDFSQHINILDCYPGINLTLNF